MQGTESVSDVTIPYFNFSATITHNDQEDVLWFEKCVVKYHGLQPLKSDTKFTKPQFKAYLRDPIPATFEVSEMTKF